MPFGPKISFRIETANKHIQPHRQLLADCIHEGFEEYFRLPEEQRMKLHARSQASDIRDFIVAAVKKGFDGLPGIEFVERRGMFLLVIDKVASIRFKKLDPRKRSRNAETQQSLQFSSGEMHGYLEATACVDAGYISDRFGKSILSAHVVFPKHAAGEPPQSLELPKPSRSTSSGVVPIAPPPPPAKTTVRVRKEGGTKVVLPFRSAGKNNENA